MSTAPRPLDPSSKSGRPVNLYPRVGLRRAINLPWSLSRLLFS